jgi:hypothetical protein
MRDCFFAIFLTAQIGLAHHSSLCTQLIAVSTNSSVDLKGGQKRQ